MIQGLNFLLSRRGVILLHLLRVRLRSNKLSVGWVDTVELVLWSYIHQTPFFPTLVDSFDYILHLCLEKENSIENSTIFCRWLISIITINVVNKDNWNLLSTLCGFFFLPQLLGGCPLICFCLWTSENWLWGIIPNKTHFFQTFI